MLKFEPILLPNGRDTACQNETGRQVGARTCWERLVCSSQDGGRLLTSCRRSSSRTLRSSRPGRLILDADTPESFPDVERFLFAEADRHCGNFRHAGPATRAVRLSVSACHELWTAFRAKP